MERLKENQIKKQKNIYTLENKFYWSKLMNVKKVSLYQCQKKSKIDKSCLRNWRDSYEELAKIPKAERKTLFKMPKKTQETNTADLDP